jgi:DNA-binding transcriptional LysR family regulator
MASKHIQDLESDLGVKLFNRTTRQISLTVVDAT